MRETLKDVRGLAHDTLHGIASSANTPIYSSEAGVVPALFSRSCWPRVVARRSRATLCWNHDIHRPIGVADLTTDGRGWLLAECHLADTRDGREAAALARSGVGGLSVHFEPTAVHREQHGGQTVRVLEDVTLREISYVSMPRDPHAAFAVAAAADDLLAPMAAGLDASAWEFADPFALPVSADAAAVEAEGARTYALYQRLQGR